MKKLLVFPLLFMALLSMGQGNQVQRLVSHLVKTFDDPHSFQVKRVSLETGVELDYVEQGDATGIPVIFLHGLADTWQSFRPGLLLLPSSIHAFAITQRGHGNSSQPENAYSIREFSNDIAAFIKQKNLGAAVIVGHSLGGLVAQQFALDHPRLTQSLVLVGTDPNYIKNPGMPELYEEVKEMKGAFSRGFMEDFQSSCIAAPIDSAFFNLLVEEGMKCQLPVFISALKSILDTDLSSRLHKINKKTLILWGEKDAICYRRGQNILKQNIRKSNFIEYANTGHSLHWENPRGFVNDLVNFIENNRLRK